MPLCGSADSIFKGNSERGTRRGLLPRSRFTGAANRRRSLDPRVPLVPAIFPEPALASGDVRELFDELHSHQVFRVLVAQLPFDSQAQRRAVLDGQVGAVQLISQNRLRMIGVVEIDALVVKNVFA